MLIADFFFVCAALAWLVAGVGAKTLLSNSVSCFTDCYYSVDCMQTYYRAIMQISLPWCLLPLLHCLESGFEAGPSPAVRTVCQWTYSTVCRRS